MLQRLKDMSIVVFVIAILALSAFFWNYSVQKSAETKKLNDSIKVLKNDVKINQSIIESLENYKFKEESVIDSFYFVREKTIYIKEENIKNIDSLSVDSNVELLKKNLNELKDYFNY